MSQPQQLPGEDDFDYHLRTGGNRRQRNAKIEVVGRFEFTLLEMRKKSKDIMLPTGPNSAQVKHEIPKAWIPAARLEKSSNASCSVGTVFDFWLGCDPTLKDWQLANDKKNLAGFVSAFYGAVLPPGANPTRAMWDGPDGLTSDKSKVRGFRIGLETVQQTEKDPADETKRIPKFKDDGVTPYLWFNWFAIPQTQEQIRAQIAALGPVV